ncbi:MAG: hypothetical protein COV59_02560 [Candidatus Magasanikbacteria bacterium CG11_big_fil_rev_8_21_14_0_20_39_34]|uniref:Transglutaminase-like domain-containing protein n=1 Tax=Candidatus Magasanikbacteria bacterium CG11_big_fil_rev_8_21_14_0_20_39_34 TaxID=1974653 RepID=A0A2H0N570_9BACT|nr:MAG: hypothetical protein COV59_02560 [Candidatus Magasanikbacteria bacterium CG11_big_fil_rev_8_21_14_0_20_39_34]
MNTREAFQKVRDIHYSIPLNAAEEDNCCSGKHKKLKKLFAQMGIDSRYRVCTFRWSDLHLPDTLASIPHEDDSTHVYLEVSIHEKWIKVDATWDPGVDSVLPVNDWDGVSDTQVAVKALEVLSPEKSNEIMESESEEDMKMDLEKNGKFYNAFNEWLEQMRKV